jgi:hypothetical protein
VTFFQVSHKKFVGDRKNLRELKKIDFSFHGSGDNKYIALRDHSTKSHRGDSKDDNELFM